MLIVLVATGLVGSFFYYIIIHGLIRGKLKPSWEVWSYGVGAGSLLISVSAAIISYYFGSHGGLWHVVALWLLVMLPLHGGYWAITSHMREQTIGDKDREN